MPARGRLARQHARLDLSKGLEHTLDVIVGEVGVHRRHVDPVEGTRFLRQLIDDWLSLADVAGPPDLRDSEEGNSNPGSEEAGLHRQLDSP